MKVENYKVPHSSFLSMEKDLNQITGSMLRNKNLKKLLYYTTENALSMPDLTDDQSVSLFGRNIRIAPKLYIDQDIVNYIYETVKDKKTFGARPILRSIDDNVKDKITEILLNLDENQSYQFTSMDLK